jgi:hypothetical protein
MRAGASSSAQRLSVEMDEYAAAYITILTSADMPRNCICHTPKVALPR